MAGNGRNIRKNRTVKITGDNFIGILVIVVLCVCWALAARAIGKPLILPDFLETIKTFFESWLNTRVMRNLWITMRRVLTGTLYAVIVGTILGLAMGYSPMILKALSPVVNSIRQVPIMAWVPLSIVWFGLGEGPTVFLIFMSAVFPLTINTIAGIAGIDENYINAARSMGANTFAIFRDVIIPGALPDFLTGVRLAVGAGWMSVICAEFIATSAGFGYLMIEAQERLQTSRLYALMLMSAIVGFAIDRLILLLDRKLTGWRFRDGVVRG